MLKAGAFVAMLPALVLCATLGRLAAAEPASGYKLPKGTRAVACKISKDPEILMGAVVSMAVDIVGEISEPDHSSSYPDGNWSVVTSGRQWNARYEVRTNASQQVGVSCNAPSITINIATIGWRDDI